ncbi:hypothetical protein L2D01_03655 [Hyphomonadaceae bacterium ML37]|nr:hypothetical protein L2D01_03655 [Hyphomonadaceae bacterium ML37]
MTRFLASEDNPAGLKPEEILTALRSEVITRCAKLTGDMRPEALHVLANNIKILDHLTGAIDLAADSTQTLNRAFGPSASHRGGPPRIGVA